MLEFPNVGIIVVFSNLVCTFSYALSCKSNSLFMRSFFIFFALSTLGFSCGSQSWKADQCRKYGILYRLEQNANPLYLPDSLGGKSIYGRFSVTVYFNRHEKIEGFAIQQIKLYKNQHLILNHYKYESKIIEKIKYDALLRKYYDFIAYTLEHSISFVKNDLPEFCDKRTAITYPFNIGDRKVE